MKLIDSHCHIHDTEFFGNQREVVYQRAIAADTAMICVGTDERSSREAVEFAATHDQAWAVVGVHPHDAKLGWGGIDALIQTAPAGVVVGIGEIGLDYFYNHSSRQEQIRALEAQIDLALRYDLPISFHIRDGFDDFWPILDNFQGVRGVMHSFTDTQTNLEKGFERGLYVGLNGISTFTRDMDQQKLYAGVPLEKMLLETDAPFLTPVPKRGTMNEPGYVELVAQFWAERRNESAEEIIRSATDNTRTLFNL